MLKQRDVDSLANLWPACLPGVQRTTKPTLTNLWPACLPGVQRTTKPTPAHLWPACWCAWRATHNQAHHESTPITDTQRSDTAQRKHSGPPIVNHISQHILYIARSSHIYSFLLNFEIEV